MSVTLNSPRETIKLDNSEIQIKNLQQRLALRLINNEDTSQKND